MTVFGRDASNYDGSVDYAGQGFLTHKATEGTTITHDRYGSRLDAARAAGVPVLGSYHVVRTPGNGGNGTLAHQLTYWLAYLDAHTPWWRTWPHWMMQVDAEKWSYDAVSAANVKAFAGLLVAAGVPAYKVTYASRGQYGDSLAGITTDLWNADYRGGPSYPGDGWVRSNNTPAGWAPYSGQTPTWLQYTSTPYDKDAFRGTLTELLVRTRSSGTPYTKEDIMAGEAEWLGDLINQANWKLDALLPIVTKLAADSASVSPEELAAFTAAAERAASGQADAVAAAVLAKLPAGALTAAQVEQAVRDAFAGGLAPATP